MARLRLSAPAESDIEAVLRRSRKEFGDAAGRRYRALLKAALLDIAEDPHRPGSRELGILGTGIRLYHLRNSRKRSEEGLVRSPRHVIMYRFASTDEVVVMRVLHDAMDAMRHLPSP